LGGIWVGLGGRPSNNGGLVIIQYSMVNGSDLADKYAILADEGSDYAENYKTLIFMYHTSVGEMMISMFDIQAI
jgi:hypothetical protein